MPKAAAILKSLELEPNEIAARTGLSRKRIDEILADSDVGLPELRALSLGLRLPLYAFASGVRPAQISASLQMLFRTTGDEVYKYDPTRENVATFVGAALEVMPALTHLPDWLQGLIARKETIPEAHRLASELRRIFFGDRPDEPILDLASILAHRGDVIIGRLRLSRYEGASLIAGNYSFIFVSPRFGARMLFSIAHELGHIIAHHRTDNVAIFERASQFGGGGRHRKSEAFVNAFASALLMPDRGVGMMLKNVREILNVTAPSIGDIEILLLARFYGVSFEVAARRCEYLELLPSGGAQSLLEEIKKNHTNPERRADEAGLPDRAPIEIPILSENILNALIEKLDDGSVSVGWAADRFGLSINDIYAAHATQNHESRN